MVKFGVYIDGLLQPDEGEESGRDRLRDGRLLFCLILMVTLVITFIKFVRYFVPIPKIPGIIIH